MTSSTKWHHIRSATNIAPIRIAMLSIHSSPIGPLGTQNTGGMSVYIREISKWLGKFGHYIDIFTCIPSPVKTVELLPNVRLIHLNKENQKEVSKEKLFSHLHETAQALIHYAQAGQLKYQMIHSHYWLSGVVGAMVQKQWRCPHLTMFHTLGRIKNITTGGESEPNRRIDHEHMLVDTVNGIVAPANAERENLLNIYHARPEKIFVIPCGVNTNRFKPMKKKDSRNQIGINGDSDIILFVGRFAPVKGLDALFEAVAELVSRHPHLKLVVAGGDDPEAENTSALKVLSEKLGIASHLCMVGRIDHSDLPLYYNAADLLVLPSSYESFGLVIMEAMACGTPVAATRTGGAITMIREGLNGTIIEKTDKVSICHSIEHLMRQIRQQKFSPQHIRDSVAGFGWHHIALSIEQTYDTLISSCEHKATV